MTYSMGKEYAFVCTIQTEKYKTRKVLLTAVINMALAVPIAVIMKNTLVYCFSCIVMLFSFFSFLLGVIGSKYIYRAFYELSIVFAVYITIIGYTCIMSTPLNSYIAEIILLSVAAWVLVGIIGYNVTLKKIQNGHYKKKRLQKKRAKYWPISIGPVIAYIFKSHELFLSAVVIIGMIIVVSIAVVDVTKMIIARCCLNRFAKCEPDHERISRKT